MVNRINSFYFYGIKRIMQYADVRLGGPFSYTKIGSGLRFTNLMQENMLYDYPICHKPDLSVLVSKISFVYKFDIEKVDIQKKGLNHLQQ